MLITKFNPHSLRYGVMLSSEDKYRYFVEELISEKNIETYEKLQEALKEESEGICMGQKVNPHGLRIGLIKNWDSEWCSEQNENGIFISNDMIHHSFKNRKIHLVQLLGNKRYKKTVNKVKTLSR